jgi:hypothetical protein
MIHIEQRSTSQILWSRIRRIMVFSDSHATRFTLALAEVMMSYNFLFDHRSLQFQALERLGYDWTWGGIMVVTTLLQIRFLLKGKYHGKDAAWFAAWDALWWIFLTSAVFSMKDGMPATQLAIAASSAWVFVSSGFTAYGKRGTDYGDASGRIRT